MENFADAIAYEVKKEIAERYFGTRRRIEEESGRYQEMLTETSRQYSARISTDLQRLRVLLWEEDFFWNVVKLSGLPEEYCRALLHKEPGTTSAELLKDLKGRGLTRAGRYRDLVYQAYRTLVTSIETYRTSRIPLEEMHEEICKEIRDFQRQNDLSGILGFFRDIDRAGNWQAGVLQGEIPRHGGPELDQELRLRQPPGISGTLPPLPSPAALKACKPQLDRILGTVYAVHSDDLRRILPS